MELDLFRLENEYLRLAIHAGCIRSLEVDPAGGKNHRPVGITAIAPLGLIEVRECTADPVHQCLQLRGIKCAFTHERFFGTTFEIYPGVPIYAWADCAWPIPEGHRMGQSFLAEESFQRAGVYIYGAGRYEDVRFRVTLRRGGPAGEALATRLVLGSTSFGYPTIWAFLDADGSWPAGCYYLEVSETAGDIRWWATKDDVYPHGCAHIDDEPVPARDVIFLCGVREEIRESYDGLIALDGPALKLELQSKGGCASAEAGFEIVTPWSPQGYTMPEPHQAPIARFLTSKTQYVPIEQFKRFPMAWPAYQSPENRSAFPGTEWIRATGRLGCDFLFTGYRNTASWPLEDSAMRMRFIGERLRLECLPSQAEPPASFPCFFTSSGDFDRVQNSFFYERSFGMGDGRAGGEWLHWISPQSCWVGPPRLERLAEGLRSQPLDEDGYVWAMRYDGGYPHGLRYGIPPRSRRHYGSNTGLISGAYRYYAWSRDRAFLEEMMPRLRRAMEFMINSNDFAWRDDLAVIVEPGHDGTTQGMAATGYDCLPFGYKCAITNAEIFEALHGMAELEEACGAPDQAARWRNFRERLRRGYNRTFWNDIAGRYIGCIDIHGQVHDYGFTIVNLLAMHVGLADPDQVRRIYHWMEHEPTATGASDTYRFAIAPRANTLDIQNWWYLEGDKEWPGNISFGLAFQNGGAFMFTSFYDLLARLRFLGSENAFRRYREILDRYQLPDRLCGGNPLFKGEIDGYQIGASVVFPEAGLVPNAFLYGFLGITADVQGLRIAPNLPPELTLGGVRNLHYAGAVFTLQAESAGEGRHKATVTCIDNPHEIHFEAASQVLKGRSSTCTQLVEPGQSLLVKPVFVAD